MSQIPEIQKPRKGMRDYTNSLLRGLPKQTQNHLEWFISEMLEILDRRNRGGVGGIRGSVHIVQ